MTVPNAIQITNGKQETSNKEFKTKTYKKASLRTSFAILYVTKLDFAIEIKYIIWLVQISSENTRAEWAEVTQMY